MAVRRELEERREAERGWEGERGGDEEEEQRREHGDQAAARGSVRAV